MESLGDEARPLHAVRIEHLQRRPVWEFDTQNETMPGRDETWVFPVLQLPVADLRQRIVAAELRLVNGAPLWAILGNVFLWDARATRLFMNVSVHLHGGWFHMAPAGAVGAARYGPEALSRLLGLSLGDVFPMAYDISHAAVGEPDVVRGHILAEPHEELDEPERSRLLLEAIARERMGD
jgi:hypothetical protein